MKSDTNKEILQSTNESADMTSAKSTQTKKFNTLYMVQLALMIAIIVIMSFTPLGYMPIGVFQLTLLTVPVAVGAILLGPKGGAICGLAFGLTSFYKSMSGLLFPINPIGCFITSVIPRIIEGFLTGCIFSSLYKLKKIRPVSFLISSLACPVLNTILYMSCIVIFFYHTDVVQSWAPNAKNPFIFVVTVVGVQAIVEAVVCCGISTAVSQTLHHVFKRQSR